MERRKRLDEGEHRFLNDIVFKRCPQFRMRRPKPRKIASKKRCITADKFRPPNTIRVPCKGSKHLCRCFRTVTILSDNFHDAILRFYAAKGKPSQDMRGYNSHAHLPS